MGIVEKRPLDELVTANERPDVLADECIPPGSWNG